MGGHLRVLLAVKAPGYIKVNRILVQRKIFFANDYYYNLSLTGHIFPRSAYRAKILLDTPGALPYYFTTRTKNVIITGKMSLPRFCTGQDTESIKKEGKPMPPHSCTEENIFCK